MRDEDVIAALLPRTRRRGRLAAAPEAEPLGASSGIGRPSAIATGSGGGIASPLTEEDGTREFYDTPREVTSPDGLLVLEVYNVKTITMTDAAGAEVVFNYANPV